MAESLCAVAECAAKPTLHRNFLALSPLTLTSRDMDESIRGGKIGYSSRLSMNTSR